MNNILVISQEHDIFCVFDEFGLQVLKVTSAAAAIVLLKDKNINPEVVFIDRSIKCVEDIVKIVVKKDIRYFIIGQEIPKPLKVEHLKKLLLDTDKENNQSAKCNNEQEPVKDIPQNIIPKDLALNEKPTLYNFFSSLKSTPKTAKIKQEPAPEMSFFIQQQVIALIRVKGGVGTTLISTHLAKSFGQMSVCIIDLNFGDGGSDLSYYLDLPQLPHWGNFIRNKNKVGFFQALVSKDEIHILQVPPTLELIHDFKKDDIARAINYAQKKFNIIIIDLPRDLNELAQEALEYATNICIVSEGHQSEVIRIKNLTDLIESPILILNKKGVDYKKQFREYLGIKDIITIEQDDLLFRCTEKRSFCPDGSPFTQGIESIKKLIINKGKLNHFNKKSGIS